MKFLLYAVLSLVLIVVIAGILAYAIGSHLPVDHVTSVSGIVDAPPARTYALITNVAAGPTWRTGLKSVQMLPPVDGKDVWIETLDHNNMMNFEVLRADALSPDNEATREVQLAEASYGAPGPTESRPARPRSRPP